MSEVVIVALIGLLGSAIGTFGGILVSNKLTIYRIEQLEKKVEKYNQVKSVCMLSKKTKPYSMKK